jgi:periplasmic protein TonB
MLKPSTLRGTFAGVRAPLRRWRHRWLAPAILVSLIVHAGVLTIAARFGLPLIEPVAAVPVIAVRLVDRVDRSPIAAPSPPVVAAPRHPEPLSRQPRPIRAEPDPAVGVPPPLARIEHSEEPVKREPTVIAAPPVAIAAPREEAAPISLERPSETAELAAKPSTEPTPVAAAVDPSVKLPHYNVAYLNNPPPPYPLAARRMRLEGLAVVRALITVDGKVEALKLERSSGSALLDDAAQRAVKGWRFVPARLGTEAVAHWVDVPIQFRLSD